ncbi:transposase [Candidatus Amesbacteria bacterium]|nr:transposase [Candidatus Amesbacteria bacterium]
MPYRTTPFSNGSYYHVFNRGVNKLEIYSSNRDYRQALLSMDYYRFVKPVMKLSKFKELIATSQSTIITSQLNANTTLVDILCFVLMPNHFHFLLKQNTDNGISRFISQFSNSYTRYYNTAHNRSGHLFQGQFKAVEIESEEQLVHVSRYIHLNPLVSGLSTKNTLSDFQWSSYKDYLIHKSYYVQSTDILAIFKSSKNYESFVLDHSDYARELELIKHLTLDIEP